MRAQLAVRQRATVRPHGWWSPHPALPPLCVGCASPAWEGRDPVCSQLARRPRVVRDGGTGRTERVPPPNTPPPHGVCTYGHRAAFQPPCPTPGDAAGQSAGRAALTHHTILLVHPPRRVLHVTVRTPLSFNPSGGSPQGWILASPAVCLVVLGFASAPLHATLLASDGRPQTTP